MCVLLPPGEEPQRELRDTRECGYALSVPRRRLERGRSREPPSALTSHEGDIRTRIILYRKTHLGALRADGGSACAHEPEIACEESDYPIRLAHLAVS